METKETVELPGMEFLDMIDKMDKVVELVLETERSLALDIALLELRDAAQALLDNMNP